VVSDASDAQMIGAAIALLCVAVALVAAWRERRRVRRADPDAVGWVDWTTVQMLALILLAVDLWVMAKGQ